MSQELQPTQDRGVYAQGQATAYGQSERDMLRALGGLDEASDGDLNMLQLVAQKTGLDPFAKEIYLVGRKTKTSGYRGEPERWETKWSVQTSIDGFRKATHRYAESKGEVASIGKPLFYNEDGETRPFWLKKWGNPVAVEVEVKIGQASSYGVATWDEYCQTKKNGEPTSMWAKLGPTMLAKCAEAQAHRRACPITAGMYTSEEMGQADSMNRESQASQPQQDAKRGLDGVRAALGQKQEESVIDRSVVDGFLQQISAANTRPELKVVSTAAKAAFNDDVPKEVSEAANDRWEELGEQ